MDIFWNYKLDRGLFGVGFLARSLRFCPPLSVLPWVSFDSLYCNGLRSSVETM